MHALDVLWRGRAAAGVLCLCGLVSVVGCGDKASGGPAAAGVADAATDGSAGAADAVAQDAGGDGSTTDATSDAASLPDVAFGAPCTAVAKQLLGPVNAVSTGVVSVLDDTDGVRTLWIDATAGGIQNQANFPRVYLNLATAQRVDLTDLQAVGSADWDLAIKRPILYTNGGTGGLGKGRAGFLFKAFSEVTSADVATTEVVSEEFFDTDCEPALDQTGAVWTSFSDWYEYDNTIVTPRKVTWLVQGGTGNWFKLQLLDYYANPDGSHGSTSARYLLKVKAL